MKKINVYKLKLPNKIELYNANDKAHINFSAYSENINEIYYGDTVNQDIAIDDTWHNKKYGFPLSDSEIKTFLIHRQCWDFFLKSEAEACLVIEDNIQLDFNLKQLADDLDGLPEDWDIFFPYDNKIADANNELFQGDLLTNNIREIKETEPYLLGFNWGSSIYFLKRIGAEKLLKIKKIKQRVEDEMLLQTETGMLNLYYSEVESFDINKYPKKKNIDREDNIKQAVLNYNTWPHEAEEVLLNVMSTLSNISQKLNINLVLHGGTLLGLVRHGGKMPWDDDIDIGIEEQYLNLFLESVDKVGLHSLKILERRTNTEYYKIWSKHGQIIQGHPHKFPFIDVWLYNIVDKDIVFKNGIIFPNSAKNAFKSVEFEGGIFNIPFNPIECLDTMYKDWKNMIRIYHWSHQNELPINYALKTKIEVDMNGRIIKS